MKKGASIILAFVGVNLMFFYLKNKNNKKQDDISPEKGRVEAAEEGLFNLAAYDQLSKTVMDSYHGSSTLKDMPDNAVEVFYDESDFIDKKEEDAAGEDKASSTLSKEEILLNRLEDQIDFDWEQLL